MPKLADGTVTPSYLNFSGSNPHTGYSNSMSDTTLRVGRVVAAHEIESDGSRNKKILEYDVIVRHANGASGYTDILYPRVKMSNMFGGATDFFRWTPRIGNFDYSTQIGDGSRVLLLCVNGNQRMSYIIGGIPNPEDVSPVLPFSDHHLEFQFNGVYANVDKDGAFTLIHRGATNNKNEVVSNEGGNGSIRFDKEGDIELGFRFNIPTDSTGIKENNDDHPYLRVVKGNEGVEAYAPGSILNTTKQRFIVATTDGVKINPNGTDPQSFLMASTYREKQEEMHSKLESLLESLSSTVSTAGQGLSTAGIKATVASKMMIVPIAGSVASAVPWTAFALAVSEAAQALTAAKETINSMKDTISSFENAADYLSDKHQHSEDPE